MNPPELLLMVQKSCVHHLRLVVYPINCRVFLHPGWFLPSTVWTQNQLEVNNVLFRGTLFEPCNLFFTMCEGHMWSSADKLVRVNQAFPRNFRTEIMAWFSWGGPVFMWFEGRSFKKKQVVLQKKSRWGQRSLKELSSRFRYCIDFYQKIIDLDY